MIGLEWCAPLAGGFFLVFLVIYFLRSRTKKSGVNASERIRTGKIFYGTQYGTALGLAKKLAENAKSIGMDLEVCDLKTYEPEELCNESLVVLILATYTDGKPTENAKWFCQWLEENNGDERVGALHLQKLNFAVFGCGNSQYSESFNVVGREVDANLAALGGRRLWPFVPGDEDGGRMEKQFSTWSHHLFPLLEKLTIHSAASRSVLPPEATAEGQSSDDEGDDEAGETGEVDMEDMGGKPSKGGKGSKEMVTPALRANLTKQGYHILGSHSGVKLCRWTKSMLRGRGGCYKHTFYGIESHRCMEATP
ncbi:hypothetical protein CYMTET_19886, partial [Cymbomonas tetramitiformis]